MIALSADELYFGYGHQRVIDGVSHTFGAGTFTAILGPNGAGKTTFIRLVTNLLQPTSGQVLLDNQPLRGHSLRAVASRMAYVPQAQRSLPHTSVFDLVLTGRTPYIGWRPSASDREIVFGVLQKLALEDLAFRDARTLSGGQLQKALLARAMAQQTDILVLDEPTANLDPHHQADTLAVLRGEAQQGKTVLMAIHDINRAVEFCSHFLLFREGRILAAGGIETLAEEMITAAYGVPVSKVRHEDRTYFLF